MKYEKAPDSGEYKKEEALLPEIGYNEPLVNELVTEGHSNFARLHGWLGNKKLSRALMLSMGFVLVGMPYAAEEIHDAGFDLLVGDKSQLEGSYLAQGKYSEPAVNLVYKKTMNAISSMKYEDGDIHALEEKTYLSRVAQIKEHLDSGRLDLALKVPGVVVDGVSGVVHNDNGHLTNILITPSWADNSYVLRTEFTGDDGKYDASETEVQIEREKAIKQERAKKYLAGYLITAAVSMENGEVMPAVIGYRQDEEQIYHFGQGYTGATENFANEVTTRTFQSGLIGDSPYNSLVLGITSKGDQIRPSITDGLSSPEETEEGIAYILDYMSKNNGAIPKGLVHKVVDAKEFQIEGFADTERYDYGTAKIARIGNGETLIFSAASVDGKARPMAGLITKTGSDYQYTSIDFGVRSGKKLEWVKFDSYPTVTPQEVQGSLLAFGELYQLTKPNNQ